MDRGLKAWAGVCFVLGSAMALAGWSLYAVFFVEPHERPAVGLLIGAGLALAALAVAVVLLARFVRFQDPEALPERCTRRPYTTLFLASFAALFIEVLLI